MMTTKRTPLESAKEKSRKFYYLRKGNKEITSAINDVNFVNCLKSVSKTVDKVNQFDKEKQKKVVMRKEKEYKENRALKYNCEAQAVSTMHFAPTPLTREAAIRRFDIACFVIYMLDYAKYNGQIDVNDYIAGDRFRNLVMLISDRVIPHNFFSDILNYPDEIWFYYHTIRTMIDMDSGERIALFELVANLAEQVCVLNNMYEDELYNFDTTRPLDLWYTFNNLLIGRYNVHNLYVQPTEAQANGTFDSLSNDITEVASKVKEKKSLFTIAHKIYEDYADGKLQNTVDSISDVLDRVERSIDKFPTTEVTELLAQIRVFVQTEKDKDVISNSTNLGTGIVVFLAVTIIAIKYKSPLFTLLSILSGTYVLHQIDFNSLTRKFGFLQICYDGITGMVQKFLSDDQLKAQASDEDLGNISNSLSMLFSFFVLQGSGKEHLAENIYRKVSLFDKVSNNLSTMIKVLITTAETVCNYLARLASGDDTEANTFRWITSSNVDIENFIAEAQAVIDRYHAHRLLITRFNLAVIETIRDKGIKLSQEYNKSRRSALPSVFNQIMSTLAKIHQEFSHYDFDLTGIRPEPAFLCLIGKAGIAKSTVSRQMTHYLLGKILGKEGLDETFKDDVNQYIYYRKAGNEYYEGYFPTTLVVVYDDIHQMVDFLGAQICEALEIIHSKNMEPLSLKMAFEGKGKTYFGALLIISSTNEKKPKFESIHCADAYFRRANTGTYICYPKNEYCTPETAMLPLEERIMDYSKLPLDDKGKPIVTLEHHLYQRVKYTNGGEQVNFIGGPVDAFDVIEQLDQDMKVNREHYEQQLKILRRMRELSAYDVNHNLSITAHRDENIFGTCKAQADDEFDAIVQKKDYLDYVKMYKVFDQEYIETDSENKIFIEMMSGKVKKMMKLFVERNVNLHKHILGFHDRETYSSFIWLLKDLYRTHNVMGEDVLEQTSFEELFLAYYHRFDDKFLNVCLSTDYEQQSAFIHEVYDEINIGGFNFSLYFHNVCIPSVNEVHSDLKTQFINFIEWFKKQFDSDHWLGKVCKYVKETIVNNKTLLAIIAGGSILAYAVKILDDKFKVITGWTKAGNYANWGTEIPLFTWWNENVTTGVLHKGYEISPGVFLDRTYSLTEIYPIKSGDPYPEGSPLSFVDCKAQASVSMKIMEVINEKKAAYEISKKIEEAHEKMINYLNDETLTVEEQKRRLRHFVDELKYMPTEEAQSVNIIRKGRMQRAKVSKEVRNLKPQAEVEELEIPGEDQTNCESQSARGLDPNGNQILEKAINCNSYSVVVPKTFDGEEQKMGSIFFIKDKFAVIPEHYFRILNKNREEFGKKYGDMKVTLKQNGVNGKFVHHSVSIDAFLEILKDRKNIENCEDLKLIRVNPQIFDIPIGTRPDFSKFIATYEQYQKLVSTNKGVVFLVSNEGKDAVIVDKIYKGTGNLFTPTYRMEDGTIYKLRNYFKYKARTLAGDCGALLALEKPSLGSVRIFGFHVTGNERDGEGFSEPLFIDKITKAIEEFNDPFVVTTEVNETRCQGNGIIAGGGFNMIERLATPVPVNYVSTIKKSVLYNTMFPAREMPAPLKPTELDGKLVDPWDHNLKKFCKGKNTLKYEFIEDICKQMLVDMEKESHTDVERRPLTMEEAILGEDHFDLGSIPRDTSPGYPDVINPKPGFPKRTRYFGKEQDYNLDSYEYKRLEREVHEYLGKCRKLIRDNDILSIDNLKDETIVIKKVLGKLKSRIFNCYPIKKQVADKMKLGAFVSWLTKNRISNMNAVGINVYSEEWDVIAHNLLRFGPATLRNIGAGDYACFDGSENATILEAIVDHIIIPWYGYQLDSDEAREIKMLMLDVYDSKHIRYDVIYEWTGGMTSGAFLTIMLNYLYNRFNFYLGWYHVHDYDIIKLKDFREFVYVIFMGDDNVFAVHPKYKDIFNFDVLVETSKLIGLTLTPEMKEGDVECFRTIEEVTFLKRRWVYSDYAGRYICPIDLDSILETLYWTRNRDDSEQITRDNVDFVLKEISLHGFDTFVAWSAKICYWAKYKLDYVSDFSSFRVALASCLKADLFH